MVKEKECMAAARYHVASAQHYDGVATALVSLLLKMSWIHFWDVSYTPPPREGGQLGGSKSKSSTISRNSPTNASLSTFFSTVESEKSEKIPLSEGAHMGFATG